MKLLMLALLSLGILHAEERWSKVLHLAEREPLVAAKEAEKILVTLQAQDPELRVHDQAFGELYQHLFANNSVIKFPNRIILIDALYRGKAGTFLLEPGAHAPILEEFYQQFTEFIRKNDSGDGPIQARAFLNFTKGLDEKQQATFLALTSKTLLDNWRGGRRYGIGVALWTEKNLHPKTPLLADSLYFMSYFLSINRSNIAAVEKMSIRARQCMRNILFKSDLPPALQLQLAEAYFNCESYHISAARPEVWEWLSDVTANYLKENHHNHRSLGLKAATGLAETDFPNIQKHAERLFKLAWKGFLPKKTPNKSPLKRTLVPLALKANKTGFAAAVVEESPEDYRGNHLLILKLGAGGFPDISNQLLNPPGVSHFDTSGLAFTRDNEKELALYGPKIPAALRLRFECYLASRKDATDKQKPKTAQLDRLISIAKRYAKEKPEAEKDQWNVLSHLCKRDASAAIVAEELAHVAQAKDYSYLIPLSSEGRRQPVFGYHLKTIIERHLGHQLDQGKTEELKKQIKILADTSGHLQQWSSIYTNDLFGNINRHITRHALTTPEAARKMADLSLFIYDAMFGFKDRKKHHVGAAIGLGFVTHAIAQDTKGWKKHLDTQVAARMDIYREIRKENTVDLFFSSYRSELASLPEFTKSCRRSAEIIMNDPLIYKREFPLHHHLFGLINCGFTTAHNVIDIVPNLPDSHAQKAEWLKGSAYILINHSPKDLPRGFEHLKMSYQLFKKADANKQANQTLSIHLNFLEEHGHFKEALELSKKINFKHFDNYNAGKLKTKIENLQKKVAEETEKKK